MGRSIHYCNCGEEIHDEMTECIACWNRSGSRTLKPSRVVPERLVSGLAYMVDSQPRWWKATIAAGIIVIALTFATQWVMAAAAWIAGAIAR